MRAHSNREHVEFSQRQNAAIHKEDDAIVYATARRRYLDSTDDPASTFPPFDIWRLTR